MKEVKKRTGEKMKKKIKKEKIVKNIMKRKISDKRKRGPLARKKYNFVNKD